MFHSKSDDDVPVVAAAVVAADPPVFQMGKTYYACVAQFPEAFEAVLLWHDPTKGFKIKPVGHDETGIVENLYHSKDDAQTALLTMKHKHDKLSGGVSVSVGTHTNPLTAATTAHDNNTQTLALEHLISRLETLQHRNICIEEFLKSSSRTTGEK